MNRSFLLAAASASSLLLVPFASGQATVATDPVGFSTVTVNANSVAALSLPLNTPASFSGPVSARTSSTIQSTGAGWAADAFGPFASKPHVIRILTGASQGRQFQVAGVVANTSDTLNITTSGVDLTQVIAAGDRFQILPVNTLGTLFGTTGAGLNTGATAGGADNVLVNTSVGWLTYYHNGTQWVREGSATSRNNTAVLPEQGLLFVRRAGSAYTFTITGAVPITSLQTQLPPGTTFLGNRFPVNTTLSGLGLHTLQGWLSGSNSSSADNVLILTSVGWLTYYYDGTKWLREGGTTGTNPTIPTGTAVLIARRGTGTLTLNQALPYQL